MPQIAFSICAKFSKEAAFSKTDSDNLHGVNIANKWLTSEKHKDLIKGFMESKTGKCGRYALIDSTLMFIITARDTHGKIF